MWSRRAAKDFKVGKGLITRRAAESSEDRGRPTLIKSWSGDVVKGVSLEILMAVTEPADGPSKNSTSGDKKMRQKTKGGRLTRETVEEYRSKFLWAY